MLFYNFDRLINVLISDEKHCGTNKPYWDTGVTNIGMMYIFLSRKFLQFSKKVPKNVKKEVFDSKVYFLGFPTIKMEFYLSIFG